MDTNTNHFVQEWFSPNTINENYEQVQNKKKGFGLRTITNLLTNQPTNQLTPWSRIFLEKLTDLHLVKKFPAFYGTEGFLQHSQ
jgi:hypothetical protein